MGGSCDHLHSGHKIFFGAAALNTKKLIIGVTCQAMLGKKQYNQVLEEYVVREKALNDYLKLFDKTLNFDVFQLTDGIGKSNIPE